MKHSLVKMINLQGETVEIAESKVEKMLNRGFTIKNSKPTKTTEPEMVQEDSHEEIEQNEEEV